MKRLLRTLLVIGLVVTLVGCGSSPSEEGAVRDEADHTLTVRSSAFETGNTIPERYTCEGEDVSPPIRVKNLPEKTDSVALIVEDPDAPGGTFDHWLLWNVRPDALPLSENVPSERTLSRLGDARQGKNGFRSVGYRGPCPPPGSEHRYVVTVYALDARLDLAAGSGKASLKKAMRNHVLASGQLEGLFGR